MSNSEKIEALEAELKVVKAENDRIEGLFIQQLSQKADIGVDLAVASELLRKAYLAMLKAGHSKPLQQQIRELLREDLPTQSASEGFNISDAPENFYRPSTPPKAPPKPNCRACKDTGCPDCY